jgi:hypothetical protein
MFISLIDIHQTLIAHTYECFSIKPAYGYGELLDVLIDRLGDPTFDRKLMNRIVRLFLKASCLKKFRETQDDVLVSLSENITTIHEFEMRHNTTIVRLLLIEGLIDLMKKMKVFIFILNRFSFRS